MRRIGLAVALTLGLVLSPFAVEAQQTEKVRRIGFLSAAIPGDLYSEDGFRQGLREHGYVESRSVSAGGAA